MLTVLSPQDVFSVIEQNFSCLSGSEKVSIHNAPGRVLAGDIISQEAVPGFNRSLVDGYALFAKDTFGCSESIPAVLKFCAFVEMGKDVDCTLEQYSCMYVPTGGKVPNGADAVVMMEFTEKLADDEVAVIKSVAPGENMVYAGDDCQIGDIVAKKGTVIKPQHIGCFASLGLTRIPVFRKPVAGIISTGDELIPIDGIPSVGQVRDVNSYMLESALQSYGCDVVCYGIVKDEDRELRESIQTAISQCDLIIVSGGSSVGQKDATARILEEFSPLLFHGISIKPGKPTILACHNHKALIGLPGHPGAAFFVTNIFVKAIVNRFLGKADGPYTTQAILDESIPANHGRTQYMGVSLHKAGGVVHAMPIQSKSGLISTLSRADGYICIERDCEGISRNDSIEVFYVV